jgi:hypothetical protein
MVRWSKRPHGAPHWIIAESLVGQVGPPVLDWLRRTVP